MLLAASRVHSQSEKYDQGSDCNYTQSSVSGMSLVCQADNDISYVDTQCRIVDQGVYTFCWQRFAYTVNQKNMIKEVTATTLKCLCLVYRSCVRLILILARWT
jgi:hypothetical protein